MKGRLECGCLTRRFRCSCPAEPSHTHTYVWQSCSREHDENLGKMLVEKRAEENK